MEVLPTLNLTFSYIHVWYLSIFRIRGTTAVEIASGLHWYLKYWCGAHVSWDKTGGIQTASIPKPGSLPLLKNEGLVIKRPVPWNYYQNVVTSSCEYQLSMIKKYCSLLLFWLLLITFTCKYTKKKNKWNLFSWKVKVQTLLNMRCPDFTGKLRSFFDFFPLHFVPCMLVIGGAHILCLCSSFLSLGKFFLY